MSLIDQSPRIDDAIDLPTAPLDLSARMRELRARSGLKQSEIARRMGLDPSIPSLWEQGKRPVPASRVRQLAEALGVTLEELLRGVPGVGSGAAAPSLTDSPSRAAMLDIATSTRIFREQVAAIHADQRTPLMTLVAAAPRPAAVTESVTRRPEATVVAEVAPVHKPWTPQQRPTLEGFIPDGWQPSDRVQDISPALPDGFWLDPVRLEKPAAKSLLRARLCEADRRQIEGKDVPGAAMAERIYQHCSKEDGFAPTGKAPLVEAIFRIVAASEYGGLTVDALIEALQERGGAVQATRALLRRLRDSARGYPIRWVDRELFA